MKRTFSKKWSLAIFALIFVLRMFSTVSANVEANTIPGTPNNLKAISAGYNNIQISWTAVPGASGYEIYRSTTSLGYYTAIKQLNSTSFTNQNLDINTAYYYRVRAYVVSGTTKVYGNYSSIVNAKPGLLTPVNFKTSSTGYNSININWNISLGATGYELYRSTSATGTFVKIKDMLGTAYNDLNLTTGKTYFYKVRAYQVVGVIKKYTNYTLVMSAKPVPGTPENLKSLHGWASISWTAVPGASGYEIYRSTTLTGTYTKLSDIDKNSYTDMKEAISSAFYYKVRAFTTISGLRVFSNYSIALPAKVMSQPRLPVDLNDGLWYAKTYEMHPVYGGAYQYSAVDYWLEDKAEVGKNVFAVQDGTVVYKSKDTVIIEHKIPLVLRNGKVYYTWYTLYGHMIQKNIYKDKAIKKGEVIGTISNVSTLFTGLQPHLHFSIYNKDYSTSTKASSISPYWLQGNYYTLKYIDYYNINYNGNGPLYSNIAEYYIKREMPKP